MIDRRSVLEVLSIGNDKKRNGSRIESDENVIVEEDVVRLKDGFDRFYRVSPDCMSLRDRVSAHASVTMLINVW